MERQASRTIRKALRTVYNALRTVRNTCSLTLNALRTVRCGLDGEPFGYVFLGQEVTMTQEEYEERLRALEQELQADLALIHAAHAARVRSLDRLRRLAMEENEPGAASVLVDGRHDGTGAAREAAPPAPAASRQPAQPRGAFLSDLEAVLSQLPEVFDKKDVVRLVGYAPTHSTFFRALSRLQEEGAVAIEDYSEGGTHTTYRKLGGSP